MPRIMEHLKYSARISGGSAMAARVKPGSSRQMKATPQKKVALHDGESTELGTVLYS